VCVKLSLFTQQKPSSTAKIEQCKKLKQEIKQTVQNTKKDRIDKHAGTEEIDHKSKIKSKEKEEKVATITNTTTRIQGQIDLYIDDKRAN